MMRHAEHKKMKLPDRKAFIAAVPVLVGVVMAGLRRLTDAGERATQTFFEDILPLLLIFAVSATGLALTVDDLKAVLDELGFNYRFTAPQGEVHYQDICPACRRGLLALNQGRTVGR